MKEWKDTVETLYIRNSWYELKSRLCTLNRAEDQINDCTLRSRPRPNAAGGFGLGLSALPQKLHTTHTVAPSLFCACFAARKPRALTTHIVDTVYWLVRFASTHPVLHTTLQHFQINFVLMKQHLFMCFLSSLFLMFLSAVTINILPVPCFISNLREKKRVFLQHLDVS